MYRILYISRFTQESLQIKNAISLFPEYDVDWVRSAQQATQILAEKKCDMIVINIEHFNQQKQALALQIRNMGQTIPILFLAASGGRLFQKMSKRLGHTGILEKPCNEREIFGVIEKMREGKKIAQRGYRRFNTDQSADIEFWNTGRKITGTLLNLSLGGAQLVVKEPTLRVGDVLKLNVELPEVSKKHEVNAKVVWAGGYDPISQSNQIGVQFVKTVEIYQSLLNRI